MADQPRQFERWLSIAGSILAPAGAIAAVLFYFGQVFTRAHYEFFGVDVDVVGLETRDVLLQSPRALLVPLVLLALLALFGVYLHAELRRTMARRPSDDGLFLLLRRSFRLVTAAGAVLLVGGVGLVFAYPWLGGWPQSDLVIPVCIMLGVVLVTYGRFMVEAASGDSSSGSAELLQGRRSRRLGWILTGIVVVACVFWATSTLAKWSGRGQAMALAARLHELPAVILDTQERLYVHDPAIVETALPVAGDQEFRYRYRNLRLLIEGGDRLFLVAAQWSNSGSTLIVPIDSAVRVQLQFQNPG